MEGSTRNPSRVEGSARADARPADWRSDLNAESRQRVVGKIISSLKKHFPPGASEGLSDFQKLAVRFEQKVYAAATSQDDYLRRISAKLLTMETRAQNGAGINSSPSVLATESQNLADPGIGTKALVDSTAQIGNADVVDRQEEIYQEIMSWKKYSTELNEFNGRITLKIAQFHHEGVNAAATKQSKQFEKAKSCQSASRLILNLLHTSKSNINSDVMRKFPLLQNFMSNFINSRKNRSVPSQPQGHSQSMPQHLPSQVSQLQQHDNHVNEVQRINLPCSVASMQSAAAPSMQLGSMPLSTAVNVPTTQQNMANTLQPTPSLDPTKQGSLDSMKQGTVGLVQQDDVGSLQTTISASQQLHQVTQLPLHQMPQHQKNDVNELKGRQSSGIKSGLYQQHYPSASQLLEEFSSPDGCEANVVFTTLGKSNAKEQPINRLIKAVQSLSPKKLSSSVNDIRSVISMIDGIAGSAPGNGSRAALGEDLVASTKFHLEAQELMSQDGNNMTKKLKRDITARPLNVMPSAGSMSDSFQQSELESTSTSNFKRQKVEVNHALLEEINEINQKLIGMVITASEDADMVAAAAGGEGTVIKCCFNAVFLCPNLKSQFASDQMSPIVPLRILIPTNYPKSSPILLDMLPSELSKEFGDLSVKAWSRFRMSLRDLPQPLLLREIVKTWDACAHKVIDEYAQQTGGGSFSSRFGAWENCVSS